MSLKKAAMSDVEFALQSPNDADAIKTAEERLAKWQADVPVLEPNEENINLFCALRKIAGDARLHPKTMLEWKNKMSRQIKHSEKLYKNHWAIKKIDVLANVLPAIRKYVVPPEKIVSRGCVVDTEVYYIVRQAITEPELDQLGIHDVAQVEVSVSLDTEVPSTVSLPTIMRESRLWIRRPRRLSCRLVRAMSSQRKRCHKRRLPALYNVIRLARMQLQICVIAPRMHSSKEKSIHSMKMFPSMHFSGLRIGRKVCSRILLRAGRCQAFSGQGCLNWLKTT